MNDKSIKVVYNASAYEQEKDKRVRDFLSYVFNGQAGEDDFTNRLEAIVEKLKDNDEFRSDYAAMNLHDYDLTTRAEEAGREKGIEEGARQNAIENARNLYANGVSIELISKSLKLPEEEVKKLTKDIVPAVL